MKLQDWVTQGGLFVEVSKYFSAKFPLLDTLPSAKHHRRIVALASMGVGAIALLVGFCWGYRE
jgi:hypothetical protein